MNYFVTSFYYYDRTDWLGPVYKFADLGIEVTNIMTYCQTVNFAKQLAIRTTTWGGFIEMMLTIAMAFVKHYSVGGSDLFDAMYYATVASDSCARSARSWG